MMSKDCLNNIIIPLLFEIVFVISSETTIFCQYVFLCNSQ